MWASNRSPMRRGLKQAITYKSISNVRRFKPIPDEEGTETRRAPGRRSAESGFKPIPDEEGTETVTLASEVAKLPLASNRSPMRRGLKLISKRRCLELAAHASNRSPMRRGLKPLGGRRGAQAGMGFKPIPDEEGTETGDAARARVGRRQLQTDPR